MTEHIQIGDVSPRINYIGDGSTVAFSYPFPIFVDADVEVYVDGMLQTLATHYAVSGAGNSVGGTVTFTTAPTNGADVLFVRRLTIARTSDFEDAGLFRGNRINDDFDYQMAAIQQVVDDQSRSIALTHTDAAANLKLPEKSSRASKQLGFDGNGDVSLSSPFTADHSARDMAASALAYAMESNDASSINGTVGPFYLVDDFEADNLAVATNATHDAAVGYYSTLSLNGESYGTWSASNVTTENIGDQTYAQPAGIRFEAVNTGALNSFDMSFSGINSSGSVSAVLYTDNSGSPDASLGSSDSQPLSSGTVTWTWGSPPSITQGTPYWIALNFSNGAQGNAYVVADDPNYGSANWEVGAGTAGQLSDGLNMGGYDFKFQVNAIYSSITNMTLVPSAVTLPTANPGDISAYLVIDPQEVISVGTDIAMTMSIDGGTTHATGSWTKVGDLGPAGLELYRVEADVSAQSGSSLTYEITTFNNKHIRVHQVVGLVPNY